ncbi:MAG: hypothetical protein JXN62_13015 [Bacteroidales bacterium]|nr:hypothetical protein [Bacteroidales bacterium]
MGIRFLKHDQEGNIIGYLNPEFLDRDPEEDEISAEIDDDFDMRDWLVIDGELVKKTDEEIEQRETALFNEQQEGSRKAAYMAEADPLFFDYQKGEIEKEIWLDKVAEIKERFPYK